MERIDARGIADERTAVRKWLDYHRATLAQKAGGVTEEQARVTLTAGGLTLLGLVWHLTKVERSWFGRVFLDDASVGPLYTARPTPPATITPPGCTGRWARSTCAGSCSP